MLHELLGFKVSGGLLELWNFVGTKPELPDSFDRLQVHFMLPSSAELYSHACMVCNSGEPFSGILSHRLRFKNFVLKFVL